MDLLIIETLHFWTHQEKGATIFEGRTADPPPPPSSPLYYCKIKYPEKDNGHFSVEVNTFKKYY